MSHKEQMLQDIGMVGFALIDLVLFLDTHPYDKSAMEYFNHYSRVMKQLEREFAQKYYPLNISMAESNKEWRWGMAQLPWEGEC